MNKIHQAGNITLFDPTTFSDLTPGIRAFAKIYNRSRAQTKLGQERLLRRWEANRHTLMENTKLPPEVIKSWQLNKLSGLVDQAFETRPFYKKLYSDAGFRTGDIQSWSDFESLPTISKQDLISNIDDITMFTPSLKEDYYSATSSGSSGVISTIFRDENTLDIGEMYDLRQFQLMMNKPFLPEDWRYSIYFAVPAYSSFDARYPLFTVSPECPVELILNHLEKLRPLFLSSFPSVLKKISEHGADLSRYGIEGISTNSEYSTRAEREQLTKTLGVEVYDEYSSEELVQIAYECPNRSYHIVEDNVYVEAFDNGTSVELVGTNLHNIAMPLIRFRQGDEIELLEHETNCACGCTFRRLRLVLGRLDDRLQVGDKFVSSELLMNAYDSLLLSETSGLAAFQIVQESLSLIQIFAVPKNGKNQNASYSIELFIAALRTLLGGLSIVINVQWLSTLPNSSAKRRLIINKIPRQSHSQTQSEKINDC